jgi:hypothetical protein
VKVARKALQLSGVPEELHGDALSCLQEARCRAKGLFAHQLRARLAAGRIARAMPWEAETVGEVLPAKATYGVVPNWGNGLNGDNTPWAEHYRMPDGTVRQVWMLGKPRDGELAPALKAEADADVARRRAAALTAGGQWIKDAPCTLPLELDRNPDSLDWRCAVARNYWARGLHPRSVKARTAWLRRNGGEYEAWARGRAVSVATAIDRWTCESGRWRIEVLRQGEVWQVNARFALLGRWGVGWRLGYEVDNARHAHPRPGFERRACLTWGWRPVREKGARP